MPTVSVLVLTYNHKNYIKQCLDSILMQQTTFPFELVLGEDESDDGTRNICIEYAEKYPDKIKLFLRSRKDVIHINGKATGRFNFIESLKACQGKYIALCEGDDYWTDPLKLQKQVDFLEAHEDYNICFHRANIITNNKLQLHEIPNHVDFNNIKYEDLLKSFNFITTASVVLRMQENLVLPYWFKKVPWGDIALYKIIESNLKIKCLPEVMSVYRIHDNGMYSQFNKLQQNIQGLHFFKIIKPYLNNDQKKMSAKRRKEILNDVITKRAGRDLFKRIYFNIYYRIKY